MYIDVSRIFLKWVLVEHTHHPISYDIHPTYITSLVSDNVQRHKRCYEMREIETNTRVDVFLIRGHHVEQQQNFVVSILEIHRCHGCPDANIETVLSRFFGSFYTSVILWCQTVLGSLLQTYSVLFF